MKAAQKEKPGDKNKHLEGTYEYGSKLRMPELRTVFSGCGSCILQHTVQLSACGKLLEEG